MTIADEIRQPRGAFSALTSRSYRIYLSGPALGEHRHVDAEHRPGLARAHPDSQLGRGRRDHGVQFLPILIFGMHTGLVADRLPKRRILLTTQTLNAVTTSALAVITITGAIRATDIYAFALATGLIFAFDGQARQAFAAEVVPQPAKRGDRAERGRLQATRLIGPAVASLLIARVGPGWVFR